MCGSKVRYLSEPKAGDMRAGLTAKYTGIGPAIISGGLLCVLGVSACCYHFREFLAYRSEAKPKQPQAAQPISRNTQQ